MSLRKIKPQKDIFHAGKWSAESDARFLTILVEKKNEGTWIPPNVPQPSAVLTAAGVVKAEFGAELCWDEIADRVALFERRYHTFRNIVNRQETHWDRELNHVHAEDKVWKQIIKKDSLAKAYYYEWEHEFYKLATIFGTDVVKDENEQAIMNISDSSMAVSQARTLIVVDSEDEEVTSPVLNVASKNRRRLFGDESQNVLDEYSSVDAGEARQWPTRNAFCPRPSFLNERSEDDVGSSCTSSSPFKWGPFM